MANKYFFRTAAGSTLIPVADGTHYCDGMDEGFGSGEVYAVLLNSAGAQITGTDGTIVFTGSPDGVQYLAATANGTITATTLKAAGTLSTYTPPTFSGSVAKLKMVLGSLAGTDITHVQAWTVRR